MTVHELTRAQARRVAVRAQWLGADRPPDLLAFVRRATLLQLDPAWAVAGDPTGAGRWAEATGGCAQEILDRLRAEGPLPSRALPDTCVVPWRSTGWTNDRNVTQMLEVLVARGQVAVAGRIGKERLWDLAERVYPDVPPVPMAEAARRRDERRLQALGIARAKAPRHPMEPTHVGEAGEEAVV